MAGKPGRSGTNKNKDKPWAEAIRMVAFRDGRRRLLTLAEKCFDAADGGDVSAIKEIGDRLDGKPVQESTVTHNRSVAELTDQELAEILSGATGSSDGDSPPSLDPQKLN
jgi:hypothetical protein